MVQLSQRLLLESMGGTALSASESEAALEAIACLLRPVLRQREPTPSRRDKQFQKIIALIDASIQSEHLRPEWLASESGNVCAQPLSAVCRQRAGGGAVY